MSQSFLPYFCAKCNNVLPVFDMNSLSAVCSKCYNIQKMSDKNRTIAVMNYDVNQGSRVITNTELMNLVSQPTTSRIKKTCANCKFGVMAFICNEQYTCTYVCLKCKTSYE